MSKPIERSSPGSEPQTAEGHPTREEIELRAHQIYAERGGANGRDVEDWLQSERELLDEKYGKTGRMAKAAAVYFHQTHQFAFFDLSHGADDPIARSYLHVLSSV